VRHPYRPRRNLILYRSRRYRRRLHESRRAVNPSRDHLASVPITASGVVISGLGTALVRTARATSAVCPVAIAQSAFALNCWPSFVRLVL
jgi:hypothetical protein